MENTIGIIGYGNMGSAIASQLESKYKIYVFDQDRKKTKDIIGIGKAKDLIDLVNKVETLILAVKPQDFDGVLKKIKHCLKEKLVISIAAGIKTKYIEKVLRNARVIRAMPNIGAKIGESVTCLCKGAFASEEDLAITEELFYYLGTTKVIKEEMMNAATAISGSGPAYIFYFIEENALDPHDIAEHTKHDLMKRLEKAAESLGFSAEEATFLAVNTTNASISLMKKTQLAPGELRKQVASKGGTTEAALEVLRKGGSWEEAARAALKRAEELSKKG